MPEYRIGELRIVPDKLRNTGRTSYDALHKFVVRAEGNVASIYVGLGKRHVLVADSFGLLPQKDGREIVAGGSCYTDAESFLVLDDYSGDFNALPKSVAEILGFLGINPSQ